MYHNFIDYPQTAKKRVRMATGDDSSASQSWFDRNRNKILIVGAVVMIGLLIIPDVYIRKYVPWVK